MANLSNIDNKFLVTTGGNIGIGDTGPTRSLSILRSEAVVNVKSSGVSGHSMIILDHASSANNYSQVRFSNAGSAKFAIGIDPQDSYKLKIVNDGNATGANTRMTITTGGNVGIGTTSPTQLLHVNSSTNNPTGIGLQNSERYYAVRSNNYSLVFSDETVGLERMRIDSSGTIIGTGTYTASGSIKIFEAQRSGGAVKSDWDYHDSSPIRMSIGTSTSHNFAIKTADTPRLTIDTSGNVGIGTSSPAVNLHVQSTGVPTIAMSSSGSITSGSRGDLAWYNSSVSTVAMIRPGAVTDNVGTDLQFYTRPVGSALTEKMRILEGADSIVQIKSEGGLDSRLDLRAAAAGGAEDQIYFSDDSTSGRGRINYTINSGTNDVMSFYTASTQRMVIDQNGNVGIGTTSPASPASVGTFLDITGRNGIGAGTAGIVLKDYDNPAWDIWTSGGNLSARYNNSATSDGFVMSSAGDISFYTSTNQGGLAASSATDNTTVRIINTSTGGQAWRLQSTGGTSGLGQGKLFLKVGGTETAANLISFDAPSGANIKMGIGTTSPGTYGPATGTVKLDVLSGDIIRSGFTNPANSWIGFTSLPGYTANSYPSVTSKSSLHFANNDKYCAYLEGADTYFGILNSSSVTKISLNTNGNTYFNGGNVGIGTTLPNNGKLQVHTASAIAFSPAVFTSGANIRLQTGGTAAAGITTGISMGVGGAAEAYIGAVQNVSTYADIVFQTYHGAYGERMRITSAGNVGIGTASPASVVGSGSQGNSVLDVQGPIISKRIMRGWYICGPITSTDSYRHIKTNLWMGGSPAGNTEYIMGGFEVKGYAYYGSYSGFGHSVCMFHNWSASFASLSVMNFAMAGFVQNPYVSSDGYCVIVLRQNTYCQPVIDFCQYYTPYPWRSSYVTAETTSNNLTGVY